MMNGSTPPTGLHFLGTDRLLVSPQRALEVPAAPHSRFLYALEAPIYAAAEGPAGPWSGRLEARELTLLHPGERLSISSETGSAAEVVLIAFDEAGERLPRTGADCRMPLRVRLPKVGHWLAELEAEGKWARQPCGQLAPGRPEALAAYFRMQSFLYDVAAAYLMGARQGAGARDALLAYAEQVRQEMNAHCDKPFDIELLARQSGASPQRFYRAFRRLTGFSPHKYLTVLRLTRSLRLLASGAGSVAEVAHAVGYTDELYFSRLFKRAMGISPRQYMQSAREELAGAAVPAGDLAPFGIATARVAQGEPAQGEVVQGEVVQGEAAPGEVVQGQAEQGEPAQGTVVRGKAVQRELAPGEAVLGDMPQGEVVREQAAIEQVVLAEVVPGKAARAEAAQGEVAQEEAAQEEVPQGNAAQEGVPKGASLDGRSWRQRIHRLGERFGLEGVACFWLSLLDRKVENAAHLLRRRWGRAEFLLIRANAEGYQLLGDDDRSVGELIYRGVGFTAPEAVCGLAERHITSLEEAAAFGCPRALFLVPSGADQSRLEAAWCDLTQRQAGAQCLFLTWNGEDAPLAYERLVEQLTRLLLEPEL